MNQKNIISVCPTYRTKSEVFKSAYENTFYFDSFADVLKNSWKFYSKY